MTRLTYLGILTLAWPIVLSNLSSPILGLVDTAAIGNYGSAAALGAVALGSVVFNVLYWAFGFLRMGTTGLTAQAHGAGNEEEIRATLLRALLIGVAAGFAVILLQIPLGRAAFGLLSGSEEVESLAHQYFAVRLWGAPAALATFALVGWFIGLGRTRMALAIELVLNGLNVALDLLFVVGLKMDVVGVALGTALSNVVAFCFAIYLARRELRSVCLDKRFFPSKWNAVFDRGQWRRTFAVNRDIMIRTMLLVFAFTWFANEGARQGDVILAANAILGQFITFAAHFLDGFAFSAEIVVGRAVGRKSKRQLRRGVRLTTELAVFVSLILCFVFALASEPSIRFLTNLEDVRQAAFDYMPWVIVGPFIGVWCYQLDGIFIGATATREMRNTAALSLVVYMIAWAVLMPSFGNHGLWAALMIYLLTRAVTLYAVYPRIERRLG